jgi:uncharacterized membrane protein
MSDRLQPVSHAVSPRALLWAAIAAYAAGFASLSILRHRAFNTGRYDLGNMVQTVWNTAHGHFLQMTSGDGRQISRLAAHFDPILALFAPLWWIWPSPELLLTVQAIAVALGALPVFWLARKHVGSERAGLAFALVYLLYPATEWLTLNEFHPVALACPFLLFAFWYLDENRLVPFSVFALLAVTTKEEIGLVVAGLGVWFAIRRRQWRTGGVVAGAGVLVSVIAIAVVIPHYNDGTDSSFYGRYDAIGGSAGGIAKTAVTHPWRLLEQAFQPGDVHYLLHLALPLGLLLVFAPLLLVAALPELALNVLSATPTQTSIHFHYVAGAIPPLLIAAVLGAAALARRFPTRTGLVVAAAVTVAVVGNWKLGAVPLWGAVPGGEDFQRADWRVTAHDRIAARAVSLVPQHVVVSATNVLGAHLSARRRVLSLPKLSDATWVAADETRSSYVDRVAPLPAAAALVRLRRSPDWRLVFERDGVLVFRRDD